jgi:hypothetical protein
MVPRAKAWKRTAEKVRRAMPGWRACSVPAGRFRIPQKREERIERFAGGGPFDAFIQAHNLGTIPLWQLGKTKRQPNAKASFRVSGGSLLGGGLSATQKLEVLPQTQPETDTALPGVKTGPGQNEYTIHDLVPVLAFQQDEFDATEG